MFFFYVGDEGCVSWWHKGHRAEKKESMEVMGVVQSVLMAASSRPGELCVNGLLLPVLRTMGLRHGGHPGGVGDRGVHGPLAGTHVAEGGVQAGALASRMAVVGVGTTLMV